MAAENEKELASHIVNMVDDATGREIHPKELERLTILAHDLIVGYLEENY